MQERIAQRGELRGGMLILDESDFTADFSALAFDTFYGEDSAFRDRCRMAGMIYYADVRSSNQFFRSEPVVQFAPVRERASVVNIRV